MFPSCFQNISEYFLAVSEYQGKFQKSKIQDGGHRRPP